MFSEFRKNITIVFLSLGLVSTFLTSGGNFMVQAFVPFFPWTRSFIQDRALASHNNDIPYNGEQYPWPPRDQPPDYSNDNMESYRHQYPPELYEQLQRGDPRFRDSSPDPYNGRDPRQYPGRDTPQVFGARTPQNRRQGASWAPWDIYRKVFSLGDVGEDNIMSNPTSYAPNRYTQGDTMEGRWYPESNGVGTPYGDRTNNGGGSPRPPENEYYSNQQSAPPSPSQQSTPLDAIPPDQTWGAPYYQDLTPRPSRRQQRQYRQAHQQDEWASQTASQWFPEEQEAGNQFQQPQSYRNAHDPSQYPTTPNSDDWSPAGIIDWFWGGDSPQQQQQQQQQGPMHRRMSHNERSRQMLGEWAPWLDEGYDDTEELRRQEQMELRRRRAAALRRVPPAGVAAWGPTGLLDVDARTKAVMDAQSDIIKAEGKVALVKKDLKKVEESVVILRVNTEVERRRFESARNEEEKMKHAQGFHECYQQLQHASLAVRRLRQDVQIAQKFVDAEKDRHWAVLSYNVPTKQTQSANETATTNITSPSTVLASNTTFPVVSQYLNASGHTATISTMPMQTNHTVAIALDPIDL